MDVLRKTFTYRNRSIPTFSGFTGYSINLLLSSTYSDIGFYDPVEEDEETITGDTYSVTGITISRLEEIRKYTPKTAITDRYFISSGATSTGVVTAETTSSVIVYYIDDIKYSDFVDDAITTYTFDTVGLTTDDIVNYKIIKYDKKVGLYFKNQINSDVNVERQEVQPFEKFYQMSEINTIADIERYAGGRYFNIVENS